MEFDELAIEQGGRRVRASGCQWLRDVDVSAEAVVALATSDLQMQKLRLGLPKLLNLMLMHF